MVQTQRHTIAVGQDFVVPEAQHAKTLCFQPCRSFGICRVASMLPAICFKDEPSGKADEVRNIWTDRDLASELLRGEAAVAQQIPERQFGRRGRMPHCFGPRTQNPLTPLA